MFQADKLDVKVELRNNVGTASVPVRFVILDPLNVSTSATAQITIQAQNVYGQVVSSYQDDVDLVSDGSSLINGLSQQERVDIVNGVGTIALTDTVPETVNLTLANSLGSITNLSSTQSIIFSNLVATKFVILNPVDTTVGTQTLGLVVHALSKTKSPIKNQESIIESIKTHSKITPEIQAKIKELEAKNRE